MESICERQNMRRALQRVRENKGAPGIDGMTVEALPDYLVRHWSKIKEQLLTGQYRVWFNPGVCRVLWPAWLDMEKLKTVEL